MKRLLFVIILIIAALSSKTYAHLNNYEAGNCAGYEPYDDYGGYEPYGYYGGYRPYDNYEEYDDYGDYEAYDDYGNYYDYPPLDDYPPEYCDEDMVDLFYYTDTAESI